MRFLVPILLNTLAVSATITKRAAAINRDNFPEFLWPTDRPIPYRFNFDFSSEDQPDVRDVFEEIASKTCLSFKEVSNEPDEEQTDGSNRRIVFANSTECVAERQWNLATVYIYLVETGCRTSYDYYFYILYALGMYITHLRPDRDQYVTVHLEEVKPNQVTRFIKMSNFSASTYGVPYDFDSLMHFTPGSYQKTEGVPKIVAKDPLHQPGMGLNRESPSHSDYLLLNRLYRCLDKCATSEVKCQNGGFLNPNNCAKCICPRGFAGRSCNEVDYYCGVYVPSTAKWQRLSVDWSSTDNYKLCYWLITAPPGRKIEIKLEYIVPEDPRCLMTPFTWLEIRLGNFVVGGYKFHCNGHIPNHTLISERNLTMLTLHKHFLDPFELELLFRNVETNSGNIGCTFAVSLVLVLSITRNILT